MKTHKEEETTQRRCIVTGQVLPKEDLIRCVVAPDQTVVPDIDAKLPGRGLWLSASRDVVNIACAKNAFSRAARQNVKPMTGLADRMEELLVQRCLSLIGMMRRAGTVIYGFEKTRAWLKDGKCAVVLAASDGADDGRAKIKALAGEKPLIELFDRAELGRAVGQDHVVHMGFAPGRLTKRFIAESLRLQGFRENSPNEDLI